MRKIFVYIALVVLLIAAGVFWFNHYLYTQKQSGESGYRDSTYLIEGKQITLVNGYSEVEVTPGSSSKIITKYFGNEAIGDLNGDGMPDVAFLLTQEQGGSGTFYYLVAAIKTSSGYQGTSGVLLGDRIAPQNTTINNAEILVSYAERKPGEPMTAEPSVGVSRYFKFENGELVEQMDLAEFGKPFDLVVNQKVKFETSHEVLLKEIQDSRCKPGTVCVWQGELSAVLTVAIPTIDAFAYKEVRLGTVKNKKIIESGYVFELQSATETTATIMVSQEVVKNPAPCYIGGCSSHVCSDQKDVVTTCEYKEEYACYKTAKCERQVNGQCGWTQTSELIACLDEKG